MEIVHYVTEEGIDIFQKWIDALSDIRAGSAVLRRLDRAIMGNFGDHKFCRDGVFEMRIDRGPGYRVYYFQL
jgi:putative addiction module killer protein